MVVGGGEASIHDPGNFKGTFRILVPPHLLPPLIQWRLREVLGEGSQRAAEVSIYYQPLPYASVLLAVSLGWQ